MALTCQGAALNSGPHYVPCGAPAKRSIFHKRDNRAYNMCSACADHNVRNRGGEDQGRATKNNPDVIPDAPPPEPVYDYSDYAEQPSAEGELSQISNLAEQQRAAEEEVEDLQRQLKNAQRRLADIAEHKLPELMDAVGMEKFSTKNGLNISIRETIRASMGGSDDLKEANYQWLEREGHDALIKLGVEVKFGRGVDQQAAARELARRLGGEGLPAQFTRKVEPASLTALIRELLEEGRPVPEEQFGVFRQRVSRISL